MAQGAAQSTEQGNSAPSGSSGGSAGAPPRLDTQRESGWLILGFCGDWTTRSIGREQEAGLDLSAEGAQRIRIELDRLGDIDTVGAWLIWRTRRDLEARGLTVELKGGAPAQRDLIETVSLQTTEVPPPPPPDSPVVSVLIHLGQASFFVGRESRDLISFLGQTVMALLRAVVQPRRLRFKAIVNQMEVTGLNAMPIVGLISFLIGVVLAYQGADQLARFGAQIFTVNLVGIGVLREMGIILTAIIVAGRSGSAFTAQIGTMKVNEEVDAMQTIGLDPMDVLVLPRVIALVLVLPLLTFYADIMGLLGGAVMASVSLDISFVQFARQLNDAVPMWAFWVGIIKAPIFAFVIALVGCFEGFKVSRSAESVGLRTTASVVESIFLVIVLDAMFSILFSVIGI